MNFNKYYVAILKKGPNWTAADSPEMEAKQQRHQQHLTHMHEAGKLAIAGPVEVAGNGSDLRGISIFHYNAFGSIDELRQLVEEDHLFQTGHLVADYMTWYFPEGLVLGK